LFDRAAQSTDYNPQKAFAAGGRKIMLMKAALLGGIAADLLSASPGTITPLEASALAALGATSTADFLYCFFSQRARNAVLELAMTTRRGDPFSLGLWWLP
jgi:hypothetical protein